VQVDAGRDPLGGRKRGVSRQVPGQTKRSYRQANHNPAKLATPPSADRSGVSLPKAGDVARLLATAMVGHSLVGFGHRPDHQATDLAPASHRERHRGGERGAAG
jgi:hypothetical protein